MRGMSQTIQEIQPNLGLELSLVWLKRLLELRNMKGLQNGDSVQVCVTLAAVELSKAQQLRAVAHWHQHKQEQRSEEHTSELQSP